MKKAVTSEADATPKLMAICCMVLAMELAVLACSSVTSAVNQRVHAGVLQRREESIAEHLRHDQPDRRALADGGEQQDQQRR